MKYLDTLRQLFAHFAHRERFLLLPLLVVLLLAGGLLMLTGGLSYVAPLGTRVAEGTVIARSDDRLLRSAMDAAQAQYDLAEETFNRCPSFPECVGRR